MGFNIFRTRSLGNVGMQSATVAPRRFSIGSAFLKIMFGVALLGGIGGAIEGYNKTPKISVDYVCNAASICELDIKAENLNFRRTPPSIEFEPGSGLVNLGVLVLDPVHAKARIDASSANIGSWDVKVAGFDYNDAFTIGQ